MQKTFDLFGNEVIVGDEVGFISVWKKEMLIGTAIKTTKKTVTVSYNVGGICGLRECVRSSKDVVKRVKQC